MEDKNFVKTSETYAIKDVTIDISYSYNKYCIKVSKEKLELFGGWCDNKDLESSENLLIELQKAVALVKNLLKNSSDETK